MGRSRRRKGLRYSPRRTVPMQQQPTEPSNQNREELLNAVGYDAIELQQTLERPLTPNEVTISALYVDVVKKRQQEDSDFEEPAKPIEFTMSKKDFPALGTKKSGKNNGINGGNDAAGSLDGGSSTDEFVSYDGDNEHDDDFSSQSEKSSSCDGAVGGVLSESDMDLLRKSNLYSHYNNSSNLANMSNIANYNFGANFNTSTPTSSQVPPPPGFEDSTMTNINSSRNTKAFKDLTIEAEELRIRLQHCLATNYNKRITDSSMAPGPPNVYPTVLGNKYGLLALANTLNERYMSEKLLDSFDKTFATAFTQDPPIFTMDPYLLGIEIDPHPSRKMHESFSGPFGHHAVGPGSVYAPVPSSYIMHERIKLQPPKISEMEAELLFYFFYLYPGDMMQMLAASELAKRNWRYHKKEKMWLRRQDGFPTYVFIGTRECGMFNYFSYNRWKICEHYFEIDVNELEHTTTKQELYDIYGYHPQMG